MDRNYGQTKLQTSNTRRSISVHRNLFRSWITESNNHKQNNRSKKRNRQHIHILSIISLLFASPSYAETVGGVSATASPVANSSGSVTNQAIQVLQGPYITNTYGAGIQCQGATRNFTPFVTGSASAQKPFEPTFDDPVFDVSDNFGSFDSDGNPTGDGIIDNPGRVLFTKKARTGQKDNYSISAGFSVTWSQPLDKELQDQCKEAAAANIALMQQTNANKRLDFEIARLKNCGELMQKGIMFSPKSPYYSVCSDVVVMNKNFIAPHRHSIPSSSVSGKQTSMPSLQSSSDAALLGAPLQIR